jgi:S-formylglutathione hydrolase
VRGTWAEQLIGGRLADLYEPPGAAQPRFAIVFLHGVGQESLRGRHGFTNLFDELGLACICPQGGESWWADRRTPGFDDRLTPEKYLLDLVLPYLRDHWNVEQPRIGLLGISMGGQGGLRLAFKYPAVFPVVAAIASAIDYHELYGQGTPLDAMYDSKEQCRQDTAPMHIQPHQYPPHLFFCIDPTDLRWYRGNDRLHEKLTALGVPHQFDFHTRAGGHGWEYFNHMAERAIRFIHEGLLTESRRLL